MFIHLHGTGCQPRISVCGNSYCIVPQSARDTFATVVVVLGVLPVLVEVQVGVRIEHRLLQLKAQRFRLPVNPCVCIEHTDFIGAGVGGVVAVIGEVQAVVAVCLEICCGVEQVIFSEGILCLHITPAQGAVDAEEG